METLNKEPGAGSDGCVKTVAALSLKEDKRYYRTERGSAGSISANAVSLITMRCCSLPSKLQGIWLVLNKNSSYDRPGATAHGSVLCF